MARTFSQDELLPVEGSRFGLGLSWDREPSGGVDVDLQAVAFDTSGKLLDAVYYNNLKAFGKAITHSSDEVTGEKSGIDECVWVDFGRLPENVGLVVFVAACHTGGHLRDALNGRFHILEDSTGNEVAQFRLEESNEEVDLIAAIHRDSDNKWTLRLVNEPAQDGQHFIDILEPTIGNFVRKVIPGAPQRIKGAFAMAKGAVVDLPKSLNLTTINACLGWDTSKGEVDLDVAAVLVDQAGAHVDTVFFDNLQALGVRHSGDNLTGRGSGDDEVIAINLEAMTGGVQQIFFVINIYTRGITFGKVANPYCRVVTDVGEEFCRFHLQEAGSEQGLVMARLAREHGRWGFQALGRPSRGNMWKDSMPDIVRYAGVKPKDLQKLPSSATASGNPSAPAPAGASDAGDATRSLRVTVASAAGLKAADWSGKSDPYCICAVPGRPDSKVQTKHKSRTLNPEWNETFVIAGCAGSGAAAGIPVLAFTLMDHDMIGGHDVLGTATLLNDHLQAGAFEGDLDVMDGSNVCGSLRLAVCGS